HLLSCLHRDRRRLRRSHSQPQDPPDPGGSGPDSRRTALADLSLRGGRQDARGILDQQLSHRRVVDAAAAQPRQDRAEDVPVAKAAELQELNLGAYVLRDEEPVAKAGVQQLDQAVDALAIAWFGGTVAVEVRL